MTFWETLNRQYYDKTFGGLDWEKIRTEFTPKVTAAKTDREFHELVNQILRRLGRSHLALVEPEYFEQLKKAKTRARIYERRKVAGLDTGLTSIDDASEGPFQDETVEGGRYGIGVELRMIGDQLLISGIEESSGARLAGLKPGYVIDKINGVTVSALTSEARLRGHSESDIKSILPIEIAEYFLNGGPETKVYLTCLDETDKPREFEVPRLRLIGKTFRLSANLPEQFLKYEARSLSPEIGYIKFNAFAEPVIGKLCDSIGTFKDKQAIILDLRGNIGGVLGTTVGLAGMLTDKKITLGEFVSRTGTEHFAADPRAKHFSGKLVVLIDGSSMSAAEMFAAGLRGSSRAVTVGDRTAGKSLPAIWTKLQTGAVLLYPIADFISPQAGSLEGKGLQPDVEIALDRKSLLDGKDVQIEKAISIITDDAMYAAKLTPPPAPKPAVDFDAAPPPPRRISSGLSTGPPPPAVAPPAQNEAGPLKMIENFVQLIGGRDALNKIQGYEIRGSMRVPGSAEKTDFRAVRQPGKTMFEFWSDALGDVREIRVGMDMLKQTGVGYEEKEKSPFDSADYAMLAPFFRSIDLTYLKGLKDEGEYEVEGRKRKILSARSPEGLYIGLTFDQASGMLATFSLPGVMYTLSDYRKVDGVMLPFRMDTDRSSGLVFDTIKLNPEPNAADFERKLRCFDVAN
jgi:carboxyl-terminal processing protease